MSLITGHRAARTHWVDNSALPGPVPELPTMMSLLLRAGYWTHGVGKMHFRGRSYGLRNLLTMEEGVAHRVDDDYLCTRPLSQGVPRPALLSAADQRRAGGA